MKKVLLASLLILALCLSLVACGGSKTAKTTASTAAPTETEEPATESTPPETTRATTPPTTTPATEATEAPAVDNGQNATPNVQSSASFEDLVRSCYYTCQSAAEDGIVRDYFTKNPIEFSYSGEDVVWYAYKSGGEYRSVYISSYGGDSESPYRVVWN